MSNTAAGMPTAVFFTLSMLKFPAADKLTDQ